MITLPQLLDNAKCFETIRILRWPDKVSCPHCGSEDIIKQGKDDRSLNDSAIAAKPVGANSTI
jgi:DNA-directed RNA polymerase subunit RPC12/RpoP